MCIRDRSGAVPFCCIFILQDAPADGLRHSQQRFLPEEAELHLVLVGVADRQFRSLQWVTEACRLDAEVDDLPVGWLQRCSGTARKARQRMFMP